MCVYIFCVRTASVIRSVCVRVLVTALNPAITTAQTCELVVSGLFNNVCSVFLLNAITPEHGVDCV